VLIDLGIFVAVGLICWFSGWRMIYHYSDGLVWAGVAAIVFGIFSLIGGWRGRTSFPYQYGRSAGEEDILERTRRDLKDTGQSYAFLVLMAVVGIVSIALGTLIQTVFR